MKTSPLEMLKQRYRMKKDGWDFAHHFTLFATSGQQYAALRPWYEKEYPGRDYLKYVLSFRGNTYPAAVDAMNEYEEYVKRF